MPLLRFTTGLFALLLFTTACAPAARERFFFPIPPAEPRVEHIGTYSTPADMQAGLLASLTGNETAPLRQPSGVATDNRGKVYVADGVNNKIKVLDFVNKDFSDFDNDRLQMPFGLDVDSKGNLYVVERKAAQVQVFDAQQTPLATFGTEVLMDPIAIAVDEVRGRIYVSDRKAHHVNVFTLAGEFIQAIGGKISVGSNLDGEFYRPHGLAVDRAGNLYVADQLNCRIQVFDPSGKFVRKFGLRGDNMSDFEGPMGIAIDGHDQLWVVDVRKAAVLTYDLSGGEPRYLFPTHGAAASTGQYSFAGPVDIAIDTDGRLYVADSLARRLSVWQYLDADYLAQHPLPADWMQRGEAAAEIWYRDSGLIPPGKVPAKP